MPEKKWIFDTVSLSNFLLSDSIFLLEDRYEKNAFITTQVYDEIIDGVYKHPDLELINGLIKRKSFILHNLSGNEREKYIKLIGHLGKGEASCIAFAKEESGIVVTDDRSARKQCIEMNIPLTGTIGILKASLIDGQLGHRQADEILNKMIIKGFYSPVRSISDIV